MIIFDILLWIAQVFIGLYVFSDFAVWLRNKKYQLIWNREREMYEKSTPKPTRAQLCEQYVMFCKRNDCSVEFKDE